MYLRLEEYGSPDAGWNELLLRFPRPHFLQTFQWAKAKAAYGWLPQCYLWRTEDDEIAAAALVLERRTGFRLAGVFLRLLYSPRGPLFMNENPDLQLAVLSSLANIARRRGAIFVKADPEVVLGYGAPDVEVQRPDQNGLALTEQLEAGGWVFAGEQVQFRNTVIVALTDEETMLGRMKQKTRYNIRLAEKRGVAIRIAELDDIESLLHMYAATSVRDGFVIRSSDYYRLVWSSFISAGLAEGLIAEVNGEPVAAVIVFRFGGRAWYVYGMSLDVHREKMPNYLLQWEAMRHAFAAGCRQYDLWGAPDQFDESDSLWGVYRFKQGLGGEVVRTMGAWDYPARPGLYALYTRILPKLLDVMRFRGKTRTRHEVGA